MIAPLALAQAASEQPSMLFQLLPFGVVMIIFYFLLIHPQRKRQKEHESMLQALEPGNKVVTSGGVVGTITKAENGKIRVKVAPSVELTVLRSHVAAKLTEDAS